MNTRRTTTRKVEENLANAGVPPQRNQIPPQDNKVPLQDQALLVPPLMTDGAIRSKFVTFAQDMTTQAQEVSTQA